MTADLLGYVLDAFKTHGNAPGLHCEITGLPGEAFITLHVPQPTAVLHKLACALESEFDELGRSVHNDGGCVMIISFFQLPDTKYAYQCES